MTPDDVRDRMRRFFECVHAERRIHDQLGALRFLDVTERELADACRRQEALLEELDRLRQERMVPLMAELSAFVAEGRAQLLQHLWRGAGER